MFYLLDALNIVYQHSNVHKQLGGPFIIIFLQLRQAYAIQSSVCPQLAQGTYSHMHLLDLYNNLECNL